MKLIVTADDLGASKEINDAIFACFEAGLVTRSSILANGDALEDLESRNLNDHALGLHFNLTEGSATSKTQCRGIVENSDLVYQKSKLQLWNKQKRSAVRSEFISQLEILRGLNIQVQYADSHHHVHTDIGVASVFASTCVSEGISQARPARTDLARSRVHLLWKKRANKIFSLKGLRIADQLFDIERFAKEEIRQGDFSCVELMLHPRIRNGRVEDSSRPGEDLIQVLKDLTNGFKLVTSV